MTECFPETRLVGYIFNTHTQVQRIEQCSCNSQCLIHEHVSFSITSKPEGKKFIKFVFLKKKIKHHFLVLHKVKCMNVI